MTSISVGGDEKPDRQETPTYPVGEYAIVEILGHQTIVGRVEDVDRFGTSMLKIEPIFKGELLSPIFQGGASIYRFSPCSAEQAFTRAPDRGYQLPPAVRVLLPERLKDQPAALPAPEDPFDDE